MLRAGVRGALRVGVGRRVGGRCRAACVHHGSWRMLGRALSTVRGDAPWGTLVGGPTRSEEADRQRRQYPRKTRDVLCPKQFHPRFQRIPLKHNWISDAVGVLSAAQRDEINNILSDLFMDFGVEAACVTVRSVHDVRVDRSAGAFPQRLFNKWGVGNPKKNTGIMLFVAVDDGAVLQVLGQGFFDGDHAPSFADIHSVREMFHTVDDTTTALPRQESRTLGDLMASYWREVDDLVRSSLSPVSAGILCAPQYSLQHAIRFSGGRTPTEVEEGLDANTLLMLSNFVGVSRAGSDGVLVPPQTHMQSPAEGLAPRTSASAVLPSSGTSHGGAWGRRSEGEDEDEETYAEYVAHWCTIVAQHLGYAVLFIGILTGFASLSSTSAISMRRRIPYFWKRHAASKCQFCGHDREELTLCDPLVQHGSILSPCHVSELRCQSAVFLLCRYCLDQGRPSLRRIPSATLLDQCEKCECFTMENLRKTHRHATHHVRGKHTQRFHCYHCGHAGLKTTLTHRLNRGEDATHDTVEVEPPPKPFSKMVPIDQRVNAGDAGNPEDPDMFSNRRRGRWALW